MIFCILVEYPVVQLESLHILAAEMCVDMLVKAVDKEKTKLKLVLESRKVEQALVEGDDQTLRWQPTVSNASIVIDTESCGVSVPSADIANRAVAIKTDAQADSSVPSDSNITSATITSETFVSVPNSDVVFNFGSCKTVPITPSVTTHTNAPSFKTDVSTTNAKIITSIRPISCVSAPSTGLISKAGSNVAISSECTLLGLKPVYSSASSIEESAMCSAQHKLDNE